MSREDENQFLSFLRSSNQVILLPTTSNTSQFSAIHSLPDASQDPVTGRFWLENMSVQLPLVTEFDEARGYYLINGFQSPVIEYLRSFSISNMMLPGRLQADMAYFDDDKGDLVSKPAEFRRWFDSIERWIKRSYRHITLLTYAGPGAEKFRSEGGLLH